MENNTQQKTYAFEISWQNPIKNKTLEEIKNKFTSIDYKKFNFLNIKITGSEDMNIGEVTTIIKQCTNEDVHCQILIVVDENFEKGKRQLSVSASFSKTSSQKTSIKLVKQDNIIEL